MKKHCTRGRSEPNIANWRKEIFEGDRLIDDAPPVGSLYASKGTDQRIKKNTLRTGSLPKRLLSEDSRS